MENLLWLLPLLACPVAMVLMMWLMGKGMSMGLMPDRSDAPRSIDELQAEQRRLASEIERLEARNGHGPRAARDHEGVGGLARRAD